MRTLLFFCLLSGLAQAQSATVRELYDWYLKQPPQMKTFAPVRGLFEPRLYAQLERVYGYNAAFPGQLFLDFDPLLGSQVGADTYSIDSERVEGKRARVVVRLRNRRGENYTQGVLLTRAGAGWLVSDWFDPKDRSTTRKVFDALDYQAVQARQAKQPDWAAKGFLQSWLARKSLKRWLETDRGRMSFAMQEEVEKSGTLLEGLSGDLVVGKATVDGGKATVTATVGGQPVRVELEKDQFNWQITKAVSGD